jgi:2-dehydropantoate 2-reductase
VREAVAVGRARGVALPDDAAERAIAQLKSFPDDARPSLLLDLEAGFRTEVDVLSGAISRMAQAAGIQSPVHDLAAAALSLAQEKAGKDSP